MRMMRRSFERGAIVGTAGAPVQVRNHDGNRTETEDGPYLKSDLPIAGFALIEASSAEEAVALVAKRHVQSLTGWSKFGHCSVHLKTEWDPKI